jgi:hypothetical protein
VKWTDRFTGSNISHSFWTPMKAMQSSYSKCSQLACGLSPDCFKPKVTEIYEIQTVTDTTLALIIFSRCQL